MAQDALARAIYHLEQALVALLEIDPGANVTASRRVITELKKRQAENAQLRERLHGVELTSAMFDVEPGQIRGWLKDNGWPEIGAFGRFTNEQLIAFGGAHLELTLIEDADIIDLDAHRHGHQRQVEPKEIRAWGLRNGHALGVRGRIPESTTRAYHVAHGLAI